eukprot:scaffold4248_cov60-Phaeocystis_antarctica.AAC.1
MFDEARHHVLGGSPLTRALRRRAAKRSTSQATRKPVVSSGRSLRHTAPFRSAGVGRGRRGQQCRRPVHALLQSSYHLSQVARWLHRLRAYGVLVFQLRRVRPRAGLQPPAPSPH